MADQNQQLADTMERLNNELRLYGELTQSTADAMNDARLGVKGASAAIRTMGGAAESVGKAATAAAGAMYEGKKGAAAFNDSITELGNAAKIAAAALALIVPGGPIIKLFVAGLGMAVAATADYVKAANEMADKLYSGYSKMAKTGAAASDGMTGLYNDAKKLGLSMNQLDSYVALIGDNSKDLALFGGTVFEGRKKFADMGKAMEPFREGLIAAGYTQEEINDASMQYLRLQTRIGQSQNMTTQQLAEGARKYLVEQDALAKITGMTRQEQEQALESARSQQRFRAKLEEMRNSGDEKQIAGAKKLEEEYTMLYKYNKKAAEGFGDITTGMVGSESAIQFHMLTMGKGAEVAQKLADNQMEVTDGFKVIAGAAKDTTKNLNMLGQTGVFEETFGSFAGGVELGIAGQRDLTKELANARAEIAKQGMEGGKAADGITGQYAANIKKQQELNKAMEDGVFKGIANAQSVTSGLASATGLLTTAFTKLTDQVNRLLNFLGLGEKAPEAPKQVTQREAEVSKVTAEARNIAKPMQERVDLLAKQLDEDEKALKNAKRSGKYGDELKPLEEKIAKNKEEYAKASQELLEQEKKIRDAALEERKVRQKQAQDQAEIRRIEAVNLQEVERLAKLNEEKADLVKKGVDTGKVDQRIKETKDKIEAGKGRIGELSKGLEMVTPTAPGKKEGEGAGAGTQKSSDVLKFTDKSGSASAFNGLEQNLQNAVVNAGEQYNAVTGNKLEINSAKRSSEDQQRLWDETVAAGRPGIGPKGMTVAQPGTSLHEQGKAVDIQNYTDPEARAALAAQGLRQPYPKNDPVHFQFRDGGIARGPNSGYPATLHGTEAVIPLKSGAIPIKFEMPAMPNMPEEVTVSADSLSMDDMIAKFSSAIKEMPARQQDVSGLGELSSTIAEMLREQRTTNDNLQKIYQATVN